MPPTPPAVRQDDALRLMDEPGEELGQLVLAACDFRTATRLMCASSAWSNLARLDSSWRPLSRALAREARLYLPDQAVAAATGTWRELCERLFTLRGMFLSECFGSEAPPPAREAFGIAVGCRFRPAGAAMPQNAHDDTQEVVLPLHQKLRLIAAAHNCSLSEARKRLWAPTASGSKSDPWEKMAAMTTEAAKENQDANSGSDDATDTADDGTPALLAAGTSHAPSSSAVGAAAEGAAAEGGDDDGAAVSAAGLLALQDGRAIICAKTAGIRAFEFDSTFGAEAPQAAVFDAVVAPLVVGVVNGRSACVLAYGQTGSGKTFTMTGGATGARALSAGGGGALIASAGLAPRAVHALLAAVAVREAAGLSARLRMSCVEVFGDQVTDLLHEGAVGGFWAGVAAAATAAGHADEEVDSVDHALELLARAEAAKRRAATMMNERSSRAHSLLMLTLEQRAVGRAGGALEGAPKVTTQLCLADLGGSEKVKKSGASGERLQEAIHINKGLLALKSVVNALNRKQSHVPFHDDQLTMLLRPSLSGGAQTYVLLAARPEGDHATETLQTLRFGETCAAVEVAAKGGADRQAAAALEALDAQVADLERRIMEKERFETFVERRRDERAGLLDAYGAGGALTDFQFEEKKVSRIVGAEKEREQLERILAARRSLLSE